MPKKKPLPLEDVIPKIKKVVETREKPGRGIRWRVSYAQYDQTEVYASLCEDLVKAMVKHSVQWPIVCREKEDYQEIEVRYSDLHRATYRIDRF